MTCPSSLRLDDQRWYCCCQSSPLHFVYIHVPWWDYMDWEMKSSFGMSLIQNFHSNEPNSSAFCSLTNSLHIHHLPDNHHRLIFIENSCFFYSPNYPRQLEVSTPIWNQYLFAMVGSSTIYCASDMTLFLPLLFHPLNPPIVVAFLYWYTATMCCFLSPVVPVLSRGIKNNAKQWHAVAIIYILRK